jgi:hypothetical protein
MLSADGDDFFKKKLFHHGGGHTDRTAVEENVVDDLEDRWIGLKMVVYDLDEDSDEVKLELGWMTEMKKIIGGGLQNMLTMAAGR